jgi:hypothetical protein
MPIRSMSLLAVSEVDVEGTTMRSVNA